MDLTDDIDDFKQKVKAEGVIGNVDSPEAGLDALAQALLCDGQNHEDGKKLNIWKNRLFLNFHFHFWTDTPSLNLIKWRGEGVKKVIIVITDEEMHYALDGILGGIVRPFDMKCHSTKNDGYTEQLRLDYPSFGQVGLDLDFRIATAFSSKMNSLYNLIRVLS